MAIEVEKKASKNFLLIRLPFTMQLLDSNFDLLDL